MSGSRWEGGSQLKRSKKRGKKAGNGGRRFTGLQSHVRRGSQLLGPMHDLNMEVIAWDRDLLPEFLWIASLALARNRSDWPTLYNRFMDAVDSFCPEGSLALGLVRDFAMIPEDRRTEFKSAHTDLIHQAFHEPFGRILAFYPDSPAHWLVQQERIEEGGSLDPTVELPQLRNLVLKLLPAKDLVAGHIRALPLNRFFKHDKIGLRSKEVVDLLPKYPGDCNDDQKYRVQQFARMVTNMHYQRNELYKDRAWPKYFWRHNYDLVPCSPRQLAIKVGRQLEPEEATRLLEVLERNVSVAIGYLHSLGVRVRCDLYDPYRHEILLGLFARMTRLYALLATDPNLWARDVAGIILRCLTETAIIFAYLGKHGTDEEFSSFRQYGEGKEKLLMLHLQDNYPGERSLEGRSAADIADELGGGFSPELIDIELADWTKKSTRDLATVAGMERFYRLVFDPASSDIHGTWVSVKNANLSLCAEPLHRFHRLPAYTEPPLYFNTIVVVQALYGYCLKFATAELGFPAPAREMEAVLLEGPSS